jgi:hypothetical protein
VGLKSLKSLNLTNGYPNKNNKNNKKNNNNKVKSKPLELFELAGKNLTLDVKKSNSSNETPNVMTVGVENYGLSDKNERILCTALNLFKTHFQPLCSKLF